MGTTLNNESYTAVIKKIILVLKRKYQNFQNEEIADCVFEAYNEFIFKEIPETYPEVNSQANIIPNSIYYKISNKMFSIIQKRAEWKLLNLYRINKKFVSLDSITDDEQATLINSQGFAYTIENKISDTDELMQILEQLPNRLKEILNLHYYKGLTINEISVKFNCSKDKVYRGHKAALALCRRLLNLPGK
ncbi:MAG: Sigma-70, region 4 [Ignavibacteria bacterium]|nr:Sigma-70, region 4 [Ignavibacteria bacterium]